MDPKKLEEIVRVLAEYDVSEFELETEDAKLKLQRGTRTVVASSEQLEHFAPIQPVVAAAPAAPAAGAPAVQEAPKDGVDPSWVAVESPIVGTFYRKPSPDAEDFVSVGVRVTKGQTLCIVEAMKLMNEIESPCAGEIKKIALEDGSVAEFGETLFYIDPS